VPASPQRGEILPGMYRLMPQRVKAFDAGHGILYRGLMGIARLSSARRGAGGGGRFGGRLAVAVAVALVSCIVVLELTRGPDTDETVAPAATPTTTATPAPPTPTATPTPGDQRSAWIDIAPVEPSPTPSPTWPPRRPRQRRPTATPVRDCVELRWTAGQVFSRPVHVAVEIDARNRCPRDLEPTEVRFTITGYRDGGQVQSVQGFAFNPLRRGFVEHVTIGLPGSMDWYDVIEVTAQTPYGTSTSTWRQR
jgi:hypothetical protein